MSDNETRILRRREVLERTKISRTHLHRLLARGQFPRPVELGSAATLGWVESEIDAWLLDRVAARRATNAC